MSEGAGSPGAAPAAPSAAPDASSTPPKQPVAPKSADKAKKPAEAAGEPEWGDADDADLFTRLQKAPWAKVKANGEEKRITSREDFLSLATDASRSRGMNKMAEETKKQQAEAKQIRDEANQQKQLIERARRGDGAAMRELGFVPDGERQELQQRWEAMTPEQQFLHQRNHELETRFAAQETKERQDQEAATETKRKANRDAVMGKAREHAAAILKDVKSEMHDVELPEIIGAMRVLGEAGQRIGTDYTTEQLAAYVQQRREAGVNSRVANMKPEAALRMAVPHLKALISTPEGMAQLEEVLGVDFELVAGKLSGRRLEKYKASKKTEALKPPTQQQKKEDRDLAREPLSPFRWRG